MSCKPEQLGVTHQGGTRFSGRLPRKPAEQRRVIDCHSSARHSDKDGGFEPRPPTGGRAIHRQIDPHD